MRAGLEMNITMENQHFRWENPLYLWAFSIAMFFNQRVHHCMVEDIHIHKWLGVGICLIYAFDFRISRTIHSHGGATEIIAGWFIMETFDESG